MGLGDVSVTAGVDRYQDVSAFGNVGHDLIPFVLINLSVVIEVVAFLVLAFAGVEFVEADHAVFVLVILREKFFPRGVFVIGFAVGLRREEEKSVASHWGGAGITTGAFDDPNLVTRRQRVALDAEGAGGDDFIGAVVVPEDRRAETAVGFGARGFPGRFAGEQVHGEHCGVLVLVTVDYYEVSRNQSAA